MTAFVIVVCVILGFAVGSFLNVVIWRVPRHESIVAPPSHCPGCDEPISPRDNVPVFSWLFLRGHCRKCGEPIPVRYPMVEIGCGVLWGVIGYTFADSWALPAYLVLAAALIALSVIDLEHYLLPNRIVYPLAGAGLVLLGVAAFAEGAGDDFVRAVLGGLAAFTALFVLHIVSPRSMGFGDVKLSFILGLYLGWLGVGETVLGLLLGFVYGAVIGLVLLATRSRGRKDHIPFGPFLAAGALTAVLVGTTILDWYRG